MSLTEPFDKQGLRSDKVILDPDRSADPVRSPHNQPCQAAKQLTGLEYNVHKTCPCEV